MLHYRNSLISFFLLLLLSSCHFTHKLWVKNYDEVFRRYLIDRNSQNILFIARNYDYAFEDRFATMAELLNSSVRSVLFINTEKTELKVDHKNNVTGYATIEAFFNRLPNKDAVFLHSIGFRSEDNGPLTLVIPLKGKRYLHREVRGYIPLLERSYLIHVKYEVGPEHKVENIILTPFAALLDSLVFIGNVLIWPFKGN